MPNAEIFHGTFSNRDSMRKASSKWRRPTKALAWHPHWRMAPGERMPIGRRIERSRRSVPAIRLNNLIEVIFLDQFESF